MSEASHTPGPWKADDHNLYIFGPLFCYGCATSLGLGVPPVEKGDLYVAVWELFRELLSMDDSIALAAVAQLRHPRAKLQRMPGSVKQLPAVAS